MSQQPASGIEEASPEPPSRIRVAAVMTVHNREATTLACLRALYAQRGHAAEIDAFVVNDGSTDGTPEAVVREFPAVRLLHGDGSLYWNGGMRWAFGAALQEGYDYYLWLNDDTHLDPEALALLLATHRSLQAREERPAIVVGSTRDPDTGVLTYGGVMRPSRLQPLKFRLLEPQDDPRPCDTMNGNCVLIPDTVARRVGNLDRAYQQKMGDFDYGLRAVAVGCSVWIAPGTIGTCATHLPRDTNSGPLLSELRRIWSTKELPPAAWAVFARRWAGNLWPAYWLSPYVRRAARVVTRRAVHAVRP